MMSSTCGTKSSIFRPNMSTVALQAYSRTADSLSSSHRCLRPESRSASWSRRTSCCEKGGRGRGLAACDRLEELDSALRCAAHHTRRGDLLQPPQLLVAEI